MVRDLGIEPSRACTRNTRPTLDHVAALLVGGAPAPPGSPSWSRTTLASFKERNAATTPPGKSRADGASRTLEPRLMRARPFRTSSALPALHSQQAIPSL